MEKRVLVCAGLLSGFLYSMTALTMDNIESKQQLPYQNQSNLNVNTNKETVFDLDSIMPSKTELSNQELLLNHGFTFSALKKDPIKKSAPLSSTNQTTNISDGLKIDMQLIPEILKLMNNNLDTHAQETKKDIEKLTPTTSKLKTILGLFGLSGSSAGGSLLGGVVTLGILIVVQKYKLI